jgi:biotin transport system substrate-specific component
MQASRISAFVRPVGGVSAMARSAVWAVGFCLLTALGAQVKVPVPWTDVPMTLQPLAVLLAGLLCRPGTAVSAMVLYAGIGAAGLPVFAPSSAGLWGPTGGYIVGFIAAAGVVSALTRDCRAGFIRLAVASAIGMVCVFALGIAWRTVFFGGDLFLAIQTGLLPFVVKAVVEVGLAAAVADRWRRRSIGR